MRNFFREHLYEKTGAFKLAILTSPLFFVGLTVKLFASAFFASEYLGKLFIPFLKYDALAGHSDSYAHFYALGILNAFPYPSMMLALMALPGHIFVWLLDADIFAVGNLELLIYRLPLLLADIGILIILSRWLKHRQRELLWLYWCSPVLFFITYVHGQLDVLPIMLVFAFLYLLFKERWLLSYLMLGIAIATKFHIVILLPFVLLYVWRKQKSIVEPLTALGVALLTFLIVNSARLFSPEFQQLVFNNSEQLKVFDLQFSLGQHIIYIIPLAYILLFLHSFSFKFFNRDVFVMFLGFAFGILTLCIAPMPGWYYWILPFFIYFYAKHTQVSKLHFIMLNCAYFLYLLLTPNSDILSVFQYVYPGIAALPSLATFMASRGLDPILIGNLALTALQATLLINVLWLYRNGIENARKVKLYSMPYVLGIAGDSGSGKSTLVSLISDIFKETNVAVVAGDALHKWERGDMMWNEFTHLDPDANELHQDLLHMQSLRNGDATYRRQYDHKTGTFTLPERLESKKLIVFEGLHSLYLKDMRAAFDCKIFIAPDEQLRTHWKILRDIEARGYRKEDVIAELIRRSADSESFIAVQARHADITISLRSIRDITDSLGMNVPLDTALTLTCTNAIDCNPFIEGLRAFLTIEHTLKETSQSMTFQGSIKSSAIERLSYYLVPDLYEIVVAKPQWSEGYNGIMQLFMCYYMLHTLTQKLYDARA